MPATIAKQGKEEALVMLWGTRTAEDREVKIEVSPNSAGFGFLDPLENSSKVTYFVQEST